MYDLFIYERVMQKGTHFHSGGASVAPNGLTRIKDTKMNQFIAPVQLERSTQLLNHGPVTLITSASGAARNVMAASWVMPLDFEPPKIIVVMDSKTLTRELVNKSGVFGVQLPGKQFLEQTLAVGSTSGRNVDKFYEFNLDTFKGKEIDVPMLGGCIAWLECKVIPDQSQRHDIIIGEIVSAYADSRIYSNNRWHFGRTDENRTAHYVAGGNFFLTGQEISMDQHLVEMMAPQMAEHQ